MVASIFDYEIEMKVSFLYDSYLWHSGLIWRVNEFRRIIVDVGHSHYHRDRPLLVSRFHRAAQLKNVFHNEYL